MQRTYVLKGSVCVCVCVCVSQHYTLCDIYMHMYCILLLFIIFTVKICSLGSATF